MSLHPPGFIEPCLPTGSRIAPTGPQWAYEIKHDGFRFICRRDGDRVRVFSRTGHKWGARLPAIAAALRALVRQELANALRRIAVLEAELAEARATVERLRMARCRGSE
jgi:ATP-dependent DNA ligase